MTKESRQHFRNAVDTLYREIVSPAKYKAVEPSPLAVNQPPTPFYQATFVPPGPTYQATVDSSFGFPSNYSNSLEPNGHSISNTIQSLERELDEKQVMFERELDDKQAIYEEQCSINQELEARVSRIKRKAQAQMRKQAEDSKIETAILRRDKLRAERAAAASVAELEQYQKSAFLGILLRGFKFMGNLLEVHDIQAEVARSLPELVGAEACMFLSSSEIHQSPKELMIPLKVGGTLQIIFSSDCIGPGQRDLCDMMASCVDGLLHSTSTSTAIPKISGFIHKPGDYLSARFLCGLCILTLIS